jgi:hypothetical protein
MQITWNHISAQMYSNPEQEVMHTISSYKEEEDAIVAERG